METAPIEELLRDLACKYPAAMVEGQLQDLPRVAFHIRLLEERVGRRIRLCDLASGVGFFPAACAQLGMRVTMIDDFQHPFGAGQDADKVPDAPDAVNQTIAETVLELHRSLGVEVLRKDVLVDGFDFPPGSLDVVTCFESMEHFHHSPRRLFAAVREALVPGGLFVLGCPNAVNLRKRITVPLGRGKWSEMIHWYEPERFRGHVREPDVDDLHYIARDMALSEVEILGRNWAGYLNQRRWVRSITPFVDRLLQLRPTLCSDIYLVGRRPT